MHPEHTIVRRDFLKLEKFEQGLEEAQHVAVWTDTDQCDPFESQTLQPGVSGARALSALPGNIRNNISS